MIVKWNTNEFTCWRFDNEQPRNSSPIRAGHAFPVVAFALRFYVYLNIDEYWIRYTNGQIRSLITRACEWNPREIEGVIR